MGLVFSLIIFYCNIIQSCKYNTIPRNSMKIHRYTSLSHKTSYLLIHQYLLLQKNWVTSFNNINQRPSPDDNLGNKVGVFIIQSI